VPNDFAVVLEYEAFRWTPSGGMVSLGDLPGGAHEGWANDVSADGSVVVGRGRPAAGEEAFRWTSEEGMVGLGDLPGGVRQSVAYAISADASVIVGRGRSAEGFEAFRWTTADGMVGLDDFIGGGFESIAYDVSRDGSVIVGYGTTNRGHEAFFWDENYGLRRLQRLLTNQGLDLTGWNLVEARGVSANGRTIVGWGRNPSGQAEAWIATVPEPSAFALVAIATIAFFLKARRKPIQPRV